MLVRCTEFGEYMGNINGHDYDEGVGCHIGGGCEECGYQGKRRHVHWVPFAQDGAMLRRSESA